MTGSPVAGGGVGVGLGVGVMTGGVPVEALEAVLGSSVALRDEGAAVTAPGQLASHYAPEARVRRRICRAGSTLACESCKRDRRCRTG